MDNQQEISHTQLAYLGGLIDGEGCVAIMLRKRPGRQGTKCFQLTPHISFTNTEKALIDEYVAILQQLGVAHYVDHREARGRNSESWSVTTRGLKRAVKLLPHLVRWCRGKKQKNAQDLLEFCGSRLSDWHAAPFTERQVALAQQISARNYGSKWEPILRDYTRSSRSSKYPNG